MLRFVMFILIVCSLTSCTNVKQSVYPEFDVSLDTIQKEKKHFEGTSANVLLLLMVDREGNVVKTRVVDWKRREIEENSVRQARSFIPKKMKMVPATEAEPDYRIFFYPMRLTSARY